VLHGHTSQALITVVFFSYFGTDHRELRMATADHLLSRRNSQWEERGEGSLEVVGKESLDPK